MPKIRGIKPETWTDDNFVELSAYARLLFIGMWNYACDNGHIEDRPKQLKMRLLPADDISVADLLRELDEKGRIVREEGYITVPTLAEHQRIDKRFFTTCDKPGCTRPGQDSGNPERETRREPAENTTGAQRAPVVHTPSSLGDCDCDCDGDCDGDRSAAGTRRGRKRPATPLPDTWAPTDGHQTFAAGRRVDLNHEADQFRSHAKANDRRQVDWNAAFRQWLGNARPSPTAAPARRLPPEVHLLERPPDGLSPAEYAAWDAEQRAKRKAASGGVG